MFYIVGTPIGNSEDISFRALKTLTKSDIILAEDTRSFSNFYQKVQKLFNMSPSNEQKIISFYKDVEFEKTPQVIAWLKGGKEVSLVSESGMPIISDPGSVLLSKIQSLGFKFSVIPGPTAFVNATILSGFPTKKILFLGFLPKKESEMIRLLSHVSTTITKDINPTIVFYESPHRIQSTLGIISKLLPKTNLAVCREMTKKFEEITRGKASELLKGEFRGELTIVISC